MTLGPYPGNRCGRRPRGKNEIAGDVGGISSRATVNAVAFMNIDRRVFILYVDMEIDLGWPRLMIVVSQT